MSILKTKNRSNSKTDRIKKKLINPKRLTALNLNIDSDLHRKFKTKAAIESMNMTDVIIEAILNYLKK